MYSSQQIELCQYRLSKAWEYVCDAEKSLEYEMYDTAANRSYYAIFHAVRALLALSGKDFRKHSGVISCFQMDYIKTGIFEKRLSDIIKSAFSLRTESDYEDFYVISREDVITQVADAREFLENVAAWIQRQLQE